MIRKFEWDTAKAKANFRKHGVDFETATEAFEDAFGIDEIDRSMDYGEDRYRLLGRAGDALILVVYAEPDDAIRIISARRATRHEHDIYYRENSQT